MSEQALTPPEAPQHARYITPLGVPTCSRRFKYVTTTASFRGKWKAQMRDDKGRQVHKGLFATQEEAAEAVDR